MSTKDSNGTDTSDLSMFEKVLYFSQACDAFLFRRFKVLGEMIHDNQKRFLFIPLILMLPMIGGMSEIGNNFEDDPRKLYVPENTQGAQDESLILSEFGLPNAIASVYGTSDPRGGNMLTTDNVLTLYDAWDNITAFPVGYNGQTYNFSGVCVKISGVCQKATILAFYDYNRTLIAELDDAALWQRLEDANFVATEQDGRLINLSSVARYDDTTNTVVSTRFTVTLEQLEDSNGDGDSELAADWALGLRDLIWGRKWSDTLRLYSDSNAEIDEEASAAFDTDLALLPVGYILLVVYATGVLSRNSAVHTHGTLAIVSFVAVCIAIIASYGLGLWFGIPFSNIILTLAFLLLGLGTDDTFVLVAAFQLPDVAALHPRDRVAEAMARAGSSISVTSLTDLVAFLAGSYTTIPVVRAFCQYAAIGVTLDFFLQVTFFAVCMHMSAEREENGKLDWLCCIMAKKPDAKLIGKGDFNQDQREIITIFIEDMYGPRLLSPIGKAVAFGISAIFIGVSIYGCTQVTMDFQYDWFVPADSYFQETLDVREAYWGSRELPSAIYTFEGNYSSQLTQTQLSEMTTALDNNDMLVPNSCVNWWPDFIAFAETNVSASMQTVDGHRIVDPSVFDTTVVNFMADEAGQDYANYLFLNSQNTIDRSQISCRDNTRENGMTYRIDQMDRMRGIADIAWSVDAVAFGPTYWVQDAHKIFLQEIIINLALAISGVFIIATLMLGSLYPSIVVTCLLIIIDMEVLASIYLSGDYFNTVTGINLVLAVGLSVDAVAHIAHSFLASDGTGNERSQHALTEIGRSVFNGAISTMVVLLPLSGARTYVFQVFFRTMMAIIGYSAFNGLVLLPVVLSILRPTSYASVRDRLGIQQNPKMTQQAPGGKDAAVSPGGGVVMGSVML